MTNFINKFMHRKCIMFIQDGAPCYHSKLMSDFLKKNIKVLDWPGNIPDLKPIENLCQAILKDWQMNISEVLNTWKWQ